MGRQALCAAMGVTVREFWVSFFKLFTLIHNKVISGFQGPPSGQGAVGRARTRDRRFPAHLRADSLATVPSIPQ
ncbi:hypothetical protein PoB_004792400 [Plakobranchus ocellatus]|uniref:Uncharacterized protein n=1 Tax=Plakobranchus ocellatus TaxID=259542 RepID=A0AAV4BSR3_9GAST|nr:hypothetical protein PoB_004792400 [Plakobranchus ocellatus]